MTFKPTNYKDFNKRLLDLVLITKQRVQVENSGKNTKLNEFDVINILKQLIRTVAEPIASESYLISVLFQDYRTGLFTNDANYLIQMLSPIVSYTSYRTVTDLVKNVLTTMQTMPISEYERYVKPKYGFLKLLNGYFDWETHTFYTQKQFENSPAFGHYHFTQQLDWEYKEKPNKDMLNIIDDIFNDWSGHNSSNKKFLFEVVQSAITGNGHQRVVIFQSDGGDGKSTFTNICRSLVGFKDTLTMNLHDISDDGTVNQLTPNIKLIYGDDAATRLSLSSKSLSRFKTLTSGGFIQVSRKFLNNILIHTTALWMQLTNTQINFLENSPAIKDRLVLYIWPNLNFREKPKTEYVLDNILKEKSFYESLIWYLFNNVDLVSKFTLSDAMISNTSELVDSADIVAQYAEHLFVQGMLDNEELPRAFVYKGFTEFESATARKPSGLSEIKFAMRFSKAIKPYGFEVVSQNRVNVKKLSPLKFDGLNGWSDIIDTKLENQFKQQRCWTNKDNAISQEFVNKIKESIEKDTTSIDVDDSKTRRVLHYLATHELNPFAQSIVSEDL